MMKQSHLTHLLLTLTATLIMLSGCGGDGDDEDTAIGNCGDIECAQSPPCEDINKTKFGNIETCEAAGATDCELVELNTKCCGYSFACGTVEEASATACEAPINGSIIEQSVEIDTQVDVMELSHQVGEAGMGHTLTVDLTQASVMLTLNAYQENSAGTGSDTCMRSVSLDQSQLDALQAAIDAMTACLVVDDMPCSDGLSETIKLDAQVIHTKNSSCISGEHQQLTSENPFEVLPAAQLLQECQDELNP